MTFYEEIAPYYDQIFPLQKSQVEFVKNIFHQPGEIKLLEVGCGIGLLSFALVNPHIKITAFDLDEGMLKEALNSMKKLSITVESLEFLHLNMLEIGTRLKNATYDGVLCFGNTLVHLSSKENVLSFFAQSKEVLKPCGTFMFQLLNYDRLLDQKISSLPLIDNDTISFERCYSYPSNVATIDFKTTLTIKKNNQKIEHTIPLFPLRKKDIESLLAQAGFSYSIFGSYTRDEFTQGSDSLVVQAIPLNFAERTDE
jgi:glycine/sarcosine N-methyltransferase